MFREKQRILKESNSPTLYYLYFMHEVYNEVYKRCYEIHLQNAISKRTLLRLSDPREERKLSLSLIREVIGTAVYTLATNESKSV